jgi:outer membrane lipoprotein
MRRQAILVVLIVAALTGCGSVISRQTLSRVDRKVTFDDLRANPDAFIGRTVLVGGRIINTTARKEETWVEVLELPLGRRDRPEDTDASRGRFLVRFSGFCDPVVYAKGVGITVAGPVEGKRTLPLGETTYTYPVIGGLESHLWKEGAGGYPSFLFGIGIGAVFH